MTFKHGNTCTTEMLYVKLNKNLSKKSRKIYRSPIRTV